MSTQKPQQAASQRLTGILTFWQLSKSGGMGKVLAGQEFFFICRKLILSGDPHVGARVAFTPRPPAPGSIHRRAENAVIDNSRAIRGDERAPKPKPKVSVGKRPLAVLTGGGE